MDPTNHHRPNNQAYLGRFWRENPHQPWRATVLRGGMECVYHFAAFESFVAFLQQRLADETTPGGDDAGSK